MRQRINALKKSFYYLRKLSTSNSVFDFAIVYGLFSSLLIFLKQVFSFIIRFNDSTLDRNLYVISIVYSMVLMLIFVLIYIQKITEKNNLANTYVKLYPFLLFVLAMMVMSIYPDPVDKVISIVVMMIFISIVQIYKLHRRILIYSFILVSFFGFSQLISGFGYSSLKDNMIIAMFTLICFIVSTIIYQIFKNHNKALDILSKKNLDFRKVIERLRETHQELKQSKIITDTMYDLTQEVLKNEKLDDVLQIVLDRAVDLIPNAQAGSILVLDESKMKYVAARGYKLHNLQKIELKPEELFQATLEDKYQPYIIRNLEVFDEVHIGKEKTERLREEAATIAKSCMTCSFKYNDEFFGSINLDNFDDENIFSEKDKYQIKQLANELEIIISVHKLYEQAIRPTKYDDLTNAYTRKYCIKLLMKMVNSKKSDPISICTIDINDLKRINDKYGHDIGDKYLTFFADSVRSVQFDDYIFGRVGGDEFLLIINRADKDEALKKIIRIREYLYKNAFIHGKFKETITFAAGISVYPQDDVIVQELIKLSDRRMYEDKHNQKK